MPKPTKKKLRKRDVEKLENTSVAAAAAACDPSEICWCSGTTGCDAASCAFSECVLASQGAN